MFHFVDESTILYMTNNGCNKSQGVVLMDENLRELATYLIRTKNIADTNTGLIDFIASILRSPVSTHVTLHSQQDHLED